jgi:hypothetical protein
LLGERQKKHPFDGGYAEEVLPEEVFTLIRGGNIDVTKH